MPKGGVSTAEGVPPFHNQKEVVCVLSGVRLFATLWSVARQAPLSMRFSRQEYWSGLHFLLQGIFPTQGSNPTSPALAGGLFTTEPAGKPQKEVLSLQEIKQNVRGLFLGIFLPFFQLIYFL